MLLASAGALPARARMLPAWAPAAGPVVARAPPPIGLRD
jgi:hypothetical protein